MFRKMFECGCNWLRIRAYVEVDDAPCLVGVFVVGKACGSDKSDVSVYTVRCSLPRV